MRFMMMHKTNAHWESGAAPSAELVADVGRMLGEMSRSGRLVAADGLRASSRGVRLEFSGGRCTVTRGPLVGANEWISSFAVLRVASLDEAIEWASRFAAVVGDAEIDIRPATEPWDIGIGTQPVGLTTQRYIAMHKADRRSEAGLERTPEQRAALGELIEEMRRAGVLLATETLQPSSQAMRLRRFEGRLTLADGPFAESKELVGGFVILDLESRQEALDWSRRYVEVLGDVELDILPLAEAGG